MVHSTLLPAAARNPNSSLRGRGVTAVLGPTNTGKTHLAIERMLGHDSGMIGLPLRLLAREVYGRLVARAGEAAVALVTGEEKIKPKNPRYWVSTVEAMPRDIDVSFAAIDEIQLIADADRGHVFTEALLHRRGRAETMLLGAATAQPIIQAVLPGVTIQTRPRLSKLSFAGQRKITRLPPRSAIIAFSAEEVYAIAELVRRQRGGAAVVMGSLSPRTRNAQVAMFQAGEVDHIVATDAIGMGLNLEIAHVAFAADRKFDGHRHRRLFPAEIAQIAGRAGRAREDGTFGSTGRCPDFDEELVECIENHAFDPLLLAQWRNSALDFSSLARLEASLEHAPGAPELVRARKAEDEVTLEILATRPLIRDLATGAERVRKLWDLCQLPDYRKVSPHIHADLVASLYESVIRQGSIDRDWFARELALCDRIDGDIDTLSWRLAQIRTWSYCANRPDWLRDPIHWQNRARALEDKVSDALHEKLMQRFVDRRTSVLMRRLKENAMLAAEVSPTGDVLVEGQLIGRLEGFRFTPDQNAEGAEAKALRATASKALAGEIETRATRLSTAGDEQLALSLDGIIRYIGEPIAAIQAGAQALEPRFVLLADEYLTGLHRELAEARLAAWLKAHIARLLGPLLALQSGETLTGIARGIAFRVAEGLGILDRAEVAQDVRALEQSARGDLRKLGIRFGAHHLFVPALMKPGPRSLAAQLYLLAKGGEQTALRDVSHLAFSGRTSIPVDLAIDKELYRVAGFRVAGPRAIRVDILERLADLIRPAIAYRPGITEGEPPPGAADGDGFVVTGAMTSLVGCAGADFAEILKSLGYRSQSRPGPAITVPIKRPAPIASVTPIAPHASAVGEGAIAADPTTTADTAETTSVQAASPEMPMPEPVLAEPARDEPEPDMPAAAAEPLPSAEAAPPSDEAQSPDSDAQSEGAVIAPQTESMEAAGEGLSPTEETGSEAPTPMMEAPVMEAPVMEALPTEVPAAPVLIEIWRVARPERAPRPEGRRDRSFVPRQNRGAPAAAGGEGPSEARPPRKEWRHRRPDRGMEAGKDATKDTVATPAASQAMAETPPSGAMTHRPAPNQGPRPTNEPPGGKRGFSGKRDGRGGKPPFDRKPDHAGLRNFQDRKPAADKPVDPDSPFAALAALKARLEGKS